MNQPPVPSTAPPQPMPSRPPRVLLLSVPALPWAPLLTLARGGALPQLSVLLAGGRSGRLRPLPPADASVHAASICTGVLPDRHGLCAGQVVQAGGWPDVPASAADLLQPPLWQHLASAGRVTRLLGWPAAWPVLQTTGVHVDHTPDALHDTAVQRWLPSLQAPAVPGMDDTVLRREASLLLARWLGLRALARPCAADADWQLLALRLDGLADWLPVRAGPGTRPGLRTGRPARAQAPAALVADLLCWLDSLLAELLAAAGPGTNLLLLAEQAAGADADGGGLLLAGPAVAAGALPAGASALDICPTVLALLGLPAPGGALALDGRSLWPARASGAAAATAGHLLPATSLPPPPLARLLRTPPDAAAPAACLAWAQARRSRPRPPGQPCAAIALLQHALARPVAPPALRHTLATWLLADGRAAEAAQVLLPGSDPADLPAAGRGHPAIHTGAAMP